MANIEMGTVYDMNKQLVETVEKEISPFKLHEKKELVKNYISTINNNYFMLLCKEKSDYTIFNFIHDKTWEFINEFSDVLIDECLKNRGQIKGIDLTEDKNAIEIWLSIDRESYCYYLFPYDLGVIEI